MWHVCYIKQVKLHHTCSLGSTLSSIQHPGQGCESISHQYQYRYRITVILRRVLVARCITTFHFNKRLFSLFWKWQDFTVVICKRYISCRCTGWPRCLDHKLTANQVFVGWSNSTWTPAWQQNRGACVCRVLFVLLRWDDDYWSFTFQTYLYFTHTNQPNCITPNILSRFMLPIRRTPTHSRPFGQIVRLEFGLRNLRWV